MALNKTAVKLPQSNPKIQPLSEYLSKFLALVHESRGEFLRKAKRDKTGVIAHQLGKFTHGHQMIGQASDCTSSLLSPQDGVAILAKNPFTREH